MQLLSKPEHKAVVDKKIEEDIVKVAYLTKTLASLQEQVATEKAEFERLLGEMRATSEKEKKAHLEAIKALRRETEYLEERRARAMIPVEDEKAKIALLKEETQATYHETLKDKKEAQALKEERSRLVVIARDKVKTIEEKLQLTEKKLGEASTLLLNFKNRVAGVEKRERKLAEAERKWRKELADKDAQLKAKEEAMVVVVAEHAERIEKTRREWVDKYATLESGFNELRRKQLRVTEGNHDRDGDK